MAISQSIVTNSDGTVRLSITVPFLVPALPSPGCLAARPLILNLSQSQSSSGGSLAGGQSAFYCLAAIDAGSLISAPSQFVEVVIPSGTNTNQVTLSGPTPFDPNASQYKVYRSLGDALTPLLISGPTSVPGGGTFTFTDTGLATSNELAPTENYRKAAVYWRLTGSSLWNFGAETHDSSQTSLTFYVPLNLGGQSIDIQLRAVGADGSEMSPSVASVETFSLTAAYPVNVKISTTGGTGGSPVDLASRGSIPPGLNNTSFSYTSTTSSVTISWTAFTLYRTDGTTVAVTAGNQTITGLASGTSYYAYPYWDEVAGAVSFVTGGSGSPSACFTSQTPAALQGQVLQSRATLNSGPITVATASSGTGGGSGGGGGTGGGCPEVGTRIETLGYSALSREVPWHEWTRIETESKRFLVAVPKHRIYTHRGIVELEDIQLGDLVVTKSGEERITAKISFFRPSRKLNITVPGGHLYWANGFLSHNTKYL